MTGECFHLYFVQLVCKLKCDLNVVKGQRTGHGSRLLTVIECISTMYVCEK